MISKASLIHRKYLNRVLSVLRREGWPLNTCNMEGSFLKWDALIIIHLTNTDKNNAKSLYSLWFMHCLLPWLVRLDDRRICPLGWFQHQQNMLLSSGKLNPATVIWSHPLKRVEMSKNSAQIGYKLAKITQIRKVNGLNK